MRAVSFSQPSKPVFIHQSRPLKWERHLCKNNIKHWKKNIPSLRGEETFQDWRQFQTFARVSDKPSPPLGPAETTESSATCVEFKWRPPKDDGGSPVSHYLLERQQVGRNTWKKLGEIPGVPRHRDTDVEHGRKYCYRIWAVTAEGTSGMMETDEMQAGTLGESHQASSMNV